jgi:hypothetical protein
MKKHAFLHCMALSTGLVFVAVPFLMAAAEPYLEPGTFRLTHKLSLEGISHHLGSNWVETTATGDRGRSFTKTGSEKNPWTTEWGAHLLTEAAARFTPGISGRILFDVQGDYADRFWRPINIQRDAEQNDNLLILQEGEGRIDQENWFLHGFSGVGHPDWQTKGDFFVLYPESYPDIGYLGSSVYFDPSPKDWRQNQFLNISRRHIPNGVEGNYTMNGLEAGAAYGNELSWGIEDSFYGRLNLPIQSSQLTFVYKDERVPASFYEENERDRAYALSWAIPFEEGHRIDVGVLYQPFRLDLPYKIARDVEPGAGLQGSNQEISEKIAKENDAFAERVRLERYQTIHDHLWIGSIDLTHAGVVAGNKNEFGAALETNITSDIKWKTSYTYRKPLEGPIPLLYEGSPDNQGAIAANPRGPESPFTVDWTNRQAVLLVTTLWYDPTPGTNMFANDPTNIAGWNINPEEDADFSVAFQHRLSDYKTSTDRQYYYNENGDLVWEPASYTGAWATEHPINEFRILGIGQRNHRKWTLGVAGGQTLAGSGLAYTTDTSHSKPITEYVSVEGSVQMWPLTVWGHYGTGVWGPEYNIHPFFGESYDRLFGLGIRTNIGVNTTWDLSYLGARQTDDLFVSESLPPFDEIRTVFSHRFGFLFQFEGPARRGYKPDVVR